MEETEEGPGGGKSVAEAATLAGSSQAECHSRGRLGLWLKLQKMWRRALSRGDVATAVSARGAGPV